MKTRHAIEWGSHLPVLIKVLEKTSGPILELGGGIHSTPFLHWAAFDQKREVVTYENIEKFYIGEKRYESDYHRVHLVKDYDEAEIERPWDVAFIDQSPAERRIVDIKRLAKWVNFIVVHDTEKKENRHYHYDEIYPLFRYHFKYRKIIPHTSVLSNELDPSIWFI